MSCELLQKNPKVKRNVEQKHQQQQHKIYILQEEEKNSTVGNSYKSNS